MDGSRCAAGGRRAPVAPLARSIPDAILNAVHAARPADTSPEAWAKQFELYRRMTSVQKARLVREVTLAANAVALAGLRQRHPSANEDELLLRLAVLRLGEDLVARAYNWRPPRDEP